MATAQPPANVVAIDFEATVQKVQTMADGSPRITLDLPEYCVQHGQVAFGWRLSRVRVVMELLEEKD